ncbi:MAG: caspase domain-containing protein [Gammaproteobacteria bacterium]
MLFRKRQIVFYLLPLLLLAGCATPQFIEKGRTQHTNPSFRASPVSQIFNTPKKLALLIGINQFEDNEWGDLRFAAKDAQDMAAVLNDNRYGQFDEVVSLTSADQTSRENIEQMLARFGRANISEDDTVVVYFSTHGTLARTDDGKLHQYLVANDTRFDDITRTAIDVNHIKRTISGFKAKKKVMVLATCHSGQGKSNLNSDLMHELKEIKGPFFVKPIEEASEATIVLAASAWGETAREANVLENDIYTHFLIEGIKKNDRNEDGAVTVTEAHDYAKQQTYYLTKGEQRPSMESVILGVDPIILSGNFERAGKPVLYDYSNRFEDLIVFVDGVAKGSLPIGVAVDPGNHTVKLARSEHDKPLYQQDFDISAGEQISIPVLLQGHDNGASLAISYQSFLTDTADQSIARPLMMVGLSYNNYSYFSPNAGFRVDVAYGQEEQVLQIGAVSSKAEVNLMKYGLSLLYRTGVGNTSFYGGPRIGGMVISRDPRTQLVKSETVNTPTLGVVAGIGFSYKSSLSFSVEASVNHGTIKISNSDTSSYDANLIGNLSLNY